MKEHGDILFKTNFTTQSSIVWKNISHLDLWPSDPAHSWQLVLQQKVVGFIIKAPLADGQVCTIAFDLREK